MSQKNKQIVKNLLNQTTSKSLEIIEKGDFQGLKKAAEKYVTSVLTISNEYKKILEEPKLKNKILQIHKRMEKDDDFTRIMLLQQLLFERQLNAFLGREVYLTYIDENGLFHLTKEADLGQVYSKATKQKGRGGLSSDKLVESKDIEQNISKLFERSVNIRKPVFDQAMERWTKNKNQEHMNYDPSQNTFYWWKMRNGSRANELAGWTIPLSRSRIIQGYAQVVINEDSKVGHPNNIEVSLQALAHSITIQSIPAAIKEDVVLNQNHFAVKSSASFRTAMIGPYLKLASNLIQINNLISKEELQHYLPGLIKIDDLADKIIKVINQKSQEDITKELNKRMKSYIQKASVVIKA